jgi:hypothetical protein
MSGVELPNYTATPLRTWKVRDPIGGKSDVHREVRDHIEKLVMELILELRRHAAGKQPVTAQRGNPA